MRRRTQSKKIYTPGMLDATAGGVVGRGRQLESAAAKRKKELGIAGVPFAGTVCFTLKTNIAGFGRAV